VVYGVVKRTVHCVLSERYAESKTILLHDAKTKPQVKSSLNANGHPC
jgi:hypothetical protein